MLYNDMILNSYIKNKATIEMRTHKTVHNCEVDYRKSVTFLNAFTDNIYGYRSEIDLKGLEHLLRYTSPNQTVLQRARLVATWTPLTILIGRIKLNRFRFILTAANAGDQEYPIYRLLSKREGLLFNKASRPQ